MPGVVFSGGLDGHIRAHDTTDGRILWEFDTVREFETVNGIPGSGGAIDGPGPVVAAPEMVPVEVPASLSEERKAALADDLSAAIHHQLRFRATFELIDEGSFELIKGTTGKTKLVEETSS